MVYLSPRLPYTSGENMSETSFHVIGGTSSQSIFILRALAHVPSATRLKRTSSPCVHLFSPAHQPTSDPTISQIAYSANSQTCYVYKFGAQEQGTANVKNLPNQFNKISQTSAYPVHPQRPNGRVMWHPKSSITGSCTR